MCFISNHDSYQLGYSSKKKVGVKCLFILSSATGYTETVLDVIDGFFNIDTYFVCTIPFFRTAGNTGICTKILFGIDVNHASAGRSGARIIAKANTMIGFGFPIIYPFHFRADELHGGNAAS